MLIAMVAIFVCCWLPLNVVHITSDYRDEITHWEYFVLIFFIAHVIAMSSTIYNPFLYAWMNENFKKEFKQVVPCLFRSRRHTSMNGLNTQYTTVDQSVMVPQHRSPVPQEKNANNINWAKDAKACYDNASETVHLKLAENENIEDWCRTCQRRTVNHPEAYSMTVLVSNANVQVPMPPFRTTGTQNRGNVCDISSRRTTECKSSFRRLGRLIRKRCRRCCSSHRQLLGGTKSYVDPQYSCRLAWYL